MGDTFLKVEKRLAYDLSDCATGMAYGALDIDPYR